ncbi:MAG: hypothetical protein O3C28_02905 [Proteobacteria bacterium]|nr:hypothetical protein [Pseudomonadota bacterium]
MNFKAAKQQARPRLLKTVATLALLSSFLTANAQESQWRTLDNISSEDRAMFDPATATARDSAIPYVPAERYPFEAPYTAEEMGYRATEFVHVSRWSNMLVDAFGVVTSSGYINQGATVFMVTTHGRKGLGGYIYDTKPGEIYNHWMNYDTFPPDAEGVMQFWTPFRTDKEFRKKMDFFVYSPQLRRVRRQPEPRRDQRFPDNSQTFDDVLGRDPWELDWQVLGTDVLHETQRFPNTRPTITLNVAGQGFVERETSSLKMMGDTFEHYLDGGSVACWVIKGTMKPDWLPGYNEKYLIMWIEKNTFFPLRIEKYGTDDRLMMVEERLAQHQIPSMGVFGYTSFNSVYWNVDHDLLSYSFHDAHNVREWTPEEEKMIFTAEFMRRDWLVEPLKTQTRIESPDQFFLRPHLYLERFPNERKITLSPEIAARYAAQEAAGKLVFQTQ